MNSLDDNSLTVAIMQLCREAGYEDTAHSLERESGLYFDMAYVTGLVQSGNWSEVENYLSRFTEPRENQQSIDTYFEIRKIAFLEALESKDHAKAFEILREDLILNQSNNGSAFSDLTKLLAVDNIREHPTLCGYLGDREGLVKKLEELINANPVLKEKLTFPSIEGDMLTRIRDPRDNVFDFPHDFVWHWASPAASVNSNSFSTDSGTASTSRGNHDISSDVCVVPPKQVTENNVPGQGYKIVPLAHNLHGYEVQMDSCPTSMDFYPKSQSLLLVGNNIGSVELWDLSDKITLCHSPYIVWDINSCSKEFKENSTPNQMKLKISNLDPDPPISVKRVVWRSSGDHFGVAFSYHLVQVYAFDRAVGVDRLRELDAHTGSVNDLAFVENSHVVSILTCGDDKKIKLWNVMTGVKLITYEGHQASVYSLCPNSNPNLPVLFSTSVDGNLKGWVSTEHHAIENATILNLTHPRVASSNDGLRFFLCGTTALGGGLVEWDPRHYSIKRNYIGFGPCQSSVPEFAIVNNILAVGDEYEVKLWDMDNPQLLKVLRLDGHLPLNPKFCFSQMGFQLAVAAGNGVKILISEEGSPLLENRPEKFEVSRQSVTGPRPEN